MMLSPSSMPRVHGILRVGCAAILAVHTVSPCMHSWYTLENRVLDHKQQPCQRLRKVHSVASCSTSITKPWGKSRSTTMLDTSSIRSLRIGWRTSVRPLARRLNARWDPQGPLFNVYPAFLKKIATFDSEYVSKKTADGQPGTPTEVYSTAHYCCWVFG